MALDASSPDGKLRALSLDGGGFRGLGMLYVLDAITKAANARNRKPTDPQLKPHEIFDIIVGSSAGGLVAVLVGRLGLSCDEAIATYTKLATALFGTSRPAFMKTLLANQKLDDTAIANYEAAVAGLAGSAQTFYTDPVSKAKTAVSVLPLGGAVPQLIPSFEPSHSSWRVHDVIRATTAATRYLPAWVPPSSPATSKGFTDAAYAGQPKTINPTIIGKKYWDKNLGILVNIGQWFSAVDVPTPLTKAGAKKLNDTFLNGAPEDPKVKTEETLLVYLKQIQTYQQVLNDVKADQSLQSAGTLQRLDPPLAPNNLGLLELVDIFYANEIKDEVQKWITNNQAQITEIATKLVKEHAPDDPEKPEHNPNVLPYNPALDAKKPKEMLAYLNTYRVIFVIDDSTSMIMTDGYTAWNDNRWRQAQSSIGPIADFTFKNNVKSVDMGFMHYRRNTPFRGIQDSQNVLRIFQQARPPQDLGRIQRTPTGAVLKFFIDEAVRELNSKINNPDEYKQIRPTDIIVLTDGEADDDPKAVMAAARQEMDRNKHNPNYIGVQFVQIGNSSTTKLKLADLTTGQYGDMADLVPSDGTDLTPEKLTRIMLGGIHPSVRRKIRADEIQ